MNYQKLNIIIVKDKYPLFNIKELQNQFSETEQFIKLDFRGAYNLIRIKKRDKQKIVFKIRYGIYKYQIMLFRFYNILTIYQILVN